MSDVAYRNAEELAISFRHQLITSYESSGDEITCGEVVVDKEANEVYFIIEVPGAPPYKANFYREQ